MTKDDIAKLPTPRTDAKFPRKNFHASWPEAYRMATEHARRLERENATLMQQLSLYADTSAYGWPARFTLAAIREYQEEA